MVRRTSWARVLAVDASACRVAKRIAALAVMSHRWGETDAEADRGLERGGQHGCREREAATSQGAAELLPRPGQPAAERAGRTSESPRRLVEREALEIAEDHRRAERAPATARSRRAGPRPARGRLPTRSTGGTVGSTTSLEPGLGRHDSRSPRAGAGDASRALALRAVRIATP